MTATAEIDGKKFFYMGWRRYYKEEPTMEDVVGVNNPAELGEI